MFKQVLRGIEMKSLEELALESVDTITSMQLSWEQGDPDYYLIVPHLKIQMAEIGASFHPTLWPHLTDMNYRLIKQVLNNGGGAQFSNYRH